ncbi:MAG: prepilin-type N-terminal cleavage/methylation domain-containing protein [Meiothermus sp.]|jgi:type IV pilus assembly protein PilA|nr:MAG: prepilin-type N-terminal cleavage/methylation domain-containing protein [Meiothermus sp.]
MRTNGFTLIELAIVIVIIGVLAAVAVPRYIDMTTQARQAQREATLSSIRSAYAIYLARNGGNPPTWAQLVTNLDASPQLKFNGGYAYMDYDNNNTAAATGERVAQLFSNDTCTTPVNNTTTAIRCIRNAIN